MKGHQRNLSLYESLNARVTGVSRDDVITLKYWAKSLDVTFPILSNVSGYLGDFFGVIPSGSVFVFNRRTVVIDKKGVIRYAKDGSPNYAEIIDLLKQLNEEDKKP
ncbi:MAG TPA: redoxin domain-containing protein [Syntrophales bacterium]|nr:redoxin domain-containing protein [Syntrophales bacterium]HOX93780.1 redoxin domain-containing protein [Syntrophales bacterium]HPI57729.1 redoxin domain-containing protein [Syntrophales bacterium]HPN23962.1 redoxin domain-containing protein [Syntrophales bacterium]HQM28241.1 redoxin domain-containing protein [Syntrophales bacterium]